MHRPEDRLWRVDDIEFIVRYSSRRSHGISISPGEGVVARVPFRTSRKAIEHMIRDKSAWIRKILGKHKLLIRIDSESFIDGAKILYRGKMHILKLIWSERSYIRNTENNTIEIGTKGCIDQQLIKSMLEVWYKTVAQKILPHMFSEILRKYESFGFSPSGFTVRRMKKRWGSCSAGGKIALSYDLIRLDDVFAEYVMLHELCHLKHHNHGHGFYRLLEKVFPDWERIREELKKVIR